MARRGRRSSDRPTRAQAAKYGPRGGTQFRVNQPSSNSSSNGSSPPAFKFPSPTGGSNAGTKIFLLIAAILVLYLVFTGHLSGVLTAIQGSQPATPKPGTKTAGPKPRAKVVKIG